MALGSNHIRPSHSAQVRDPWTGLQAQASNLHQKIYYSSTSIHRLTFQGPDGLFERVPGGPVSIFSLAQNTLTYPANLPYLYIDPPNS